MALSDLTVRNFRKEDLQLLRELYENLSTRSLHFSRDASFLEYFMDYPGVEDGVFVVQAADEITGFAIISVTEEMGLKQGNILELQVKDASSMRALIHEALIYCKNRDVDTVIVVPPPLEDAEKILEDWIRFETGVMMTRTLSASSVLQALFSNVEIRKSCVNKRIVYHVGDEIVEVKVTPTLAEIINLDSEPKEADVLVSMSPQTLLKIIFCRGNPYLAYLTGKIRIRAVRNTLRILRLLNKMKFALPFHVSLVDRI